MQLFFQAIATAIDAFAVGVSLRAESVDLLSAVTIIGVTTALLCVVAFARFCPPQNPEKGLRRLDLSAWNFPGKDTLVLPPIPPPEPIPEPEGPDTSAHRILFVGDSMVDAANNPNGAMNAFMGMGMAQGIGGGAVANMYAQGGAQPAQPQK